MSFKLGLTGSIGMGKSTTAGMFAEEGCEVWNADDAVHRMYQAGGSAVAPMKKLFPSAIVEGAVDRTRLKQLISASPGALAKIESIVHPLVALDREKFITHSTADVLVFDIPLLFETGGDAAMDAVACASAPADIQRERVLARGTMSEAQFEQILAKQMPDTEKRARADFVIETDTMESARTQVRAILSQIRAGLKHA